LLLLTVFSKYIGQLISNFMCRIIMDILLCIRTKWGGKFDKFIIISVTRQWMYRYKPTYICDATSTRVL